MRKTWIGVLAGCLGWSMLAQGQGMIRGNVSEETGVPIAFATVCLFTQKDTTQLIQHSLSDLNGNFQLPQVQQGSYQVRVSILGFSTQNREIKIASGTESPFLQFTLRAEAQRLEAVAVQGKSVRVAADKIVYVITPQELKGKTQALELVSRIPKLSVDPVEQKIVSHDGKQVKILVNGMNASETTLKALRPEQIIRMEHYDIPPARFAQYGSVLNIITKSSEQGWEAGLDVEHAFSTGFGNDMGWIRFSQGRSQWSLDYSLNYRDYSHRDQNFTQNYQFDSVRYSRKEQLKNAFGYEDHQINLGYVYQDSAQRSLQVKFSPNYMPMHNLGKSSILFGAGDSESLRTGNQNRNSYVFNPVLDVYGSKVWQNGQEFVVNLVGTAFNTRNRYVNEEKNALQEMVLEDFMNQNNRKYSLIAEAVYSRKAGSGKWELGYQSEANRLVSTIDNTFENSQYTTHYQQQYGFTQWTGRWNKWMLNAQLGLAYRGSKSAQESYDAWIFRPLFMLGYQWNDHHSIRWVSKRENQEPGIAEWSSNRVYESDHVIKQGNPYLRYSVDNETYLDYSFQWKGGSLEVIPYFCYTQSPINSYYTLKPDAIVYAAENGDFQKKYGFEYVFQWRPFQTAWLQLYVSGECMKTELSSSFIGKYEHWNYPVNYRLISNIQDFTFYYVGKIIGSHLDGPYLVDDENAGHLAAKYVKGAWGFTCSAYWLGTASKYYMHTIPQSYVQKEYSTRIHDNASMLVFGVSYSWAKGKSYKQAEKQLHHRDGDAGIFR